MNRARTLCVSFLFLLLCSTALAPAAHAQAITATLEGQVRDASGGSVAGASVTAVNAATGLSRSATTNENGDFRLALLPAGEYTVSVEKSGFSKQGRKITLQVDQVARLDFDLQVGALAERVEVSEEATGAIEPTRAAVSTVITPAQITNLPVNGRQFIDFVLLAPGVSIGNTTSGSTDVIVEPVTKISFAGQNIHYNFVAIDGADNMSTASGIQKTTPSQDAVQEFRVVNAEYSSIFGRSSAGLVNIITKSGGNEVHGSVYGYFRSDAFDARSILQAPGLDNLEQAQYGFALGGKIRKDRSFYFLNYEGQRRNESPFYNSAILTNLTAINGAKTTLYGLPAENLDVNRESDNDNALLKLDHQFSSKHSLSARYFINDARFSNVSPLNDGFDLPSAFKDNFFRDQSLVGVLTSSFTQSLINELRLQWARRSFDFPVASTQPHLEVANTFAIGVNRGNPDFYRESRFELVENLTWVRGRHTVAFGGNYNFVRTTESFPLFYPFEATFATLNDLVNGTPFVIFFQRFQAPGFNEPTIPSSVYQGRRISSAVRDQSTGVIDHTYNAFYIQDKIRITNRLTLTAGLRYEFETFPNEALDNDLNNWDPRLGIAYNLGTRWNIVLRGGLGIFHGIIPNPLLSCQIPSCGGQAKYPGRESKQNDLNATTNLFAFASAPFITNLALTSILGQPNILIAAPGGNGTYVDAVPAAAIGCPSGFLSSCGFFGESVVVRFARDHQNPLAYQGGLSMEMQPVKNLFFNLSYLRVRALRLGSFFNVNQPDPTAVITAHTSAGTAGPKNTYFVGGFPTGRDPRFAIYFEADSRWDAVYDGFFFTVDKRAGKYFNFSTSYTWSKGIDNGPNPSFVLIPQDSQNWRPERALSADHAEHRFTGNASVQTPGGWHPVARDFILSTIITLESPHFFTKFAGFDANGDIFGVNDRVGIEPRNTFEGDSLKAVDIRITRFFPIKEKRKIELIFEAFNLFNTLNVKFFNTTYGAADFCPIGGVAVCGAGPFFREGSPNPAYGTPRAVNNPRQIQFAFRFTF